MKKEDILLVERVKIIRVADSRDSVADAEKIPKSSENQVFRNDSQEFTKIKNIILKLMVKFVSRNYLSF